MLVYQRVIGRYWTSAHLRSICHWIAHPNHPNPCETWARDMCDIFCYNRRCTAATLPHAQPIHRLRTKKPKWIKMDGQCYWEVMRFFFTGKPWDFSDTPCSDKAFGYFLHLFVGDYLFGKFPERLIAQLLATMFNSWHASSRSKMSWNLLLTSTLW